MTVYYREMQVKKTMLAALAVLALLISPLARAEPPSEASLRELFDLTHVQSIMAAMKANIEAGNEKGFAAAAANRTFTVDQQRIMDEYRLRQKAVMDDELSWEKLQPIYIQVYRENFSQEDVDAINAFYRTPAGRALVDKLPTTMQRVSQLMQPSLQVAIQKSVALQTEYTAKFRAVTPSVSNPAAAQSSQPQTPQ